MNERSPLVLQIYDRSIEEECFLGFAELRPKLVNNHTIDQWFPLQARPGEDHAVTGEIRIQIRYEKYDVSSPLFQLQYALERQSPLTKSFPPVDETGVVGQRFRLPSDDRERNIRTSVPSPEKGHEANLRHEGPLEAGNRREERDRPHDRGTQDPATFE